MNDVKVRLSDGGMVTVQAGRVTVVNGTGQTVALQEHDLIVILMAEIQTLHAVIMSQKEAQVGLQMAFERMLQKVLPA
jgi:hypothetical protein